MRTGLDQVKIEPFWLNQHVESGNYIDNFACIHNISNMYLHMHACVDPNISMQIVTDMIYSFCHLFEGCLHLFC